VRRRRWGQWIPGSLSFWMSSHVLTGILAILAVLVHGGFTARESVGGYAFACMAVVVIAGAIGRYLYSFVPRAANGRELALDEARADFDRLSSAWDARGSDFARRVRETIDAVLEHGRWRRSFMGRAVALLTSERRMARELAHLRRLGEDEDIARVELDRSIGLARSAHRAARAVAHYEDLRALLGTWRYVHRWLALLLVLFVGAHVWTALRYADLGAPIDPNESNREAMLDARTETEQ